MAAIVFLIAPKDFRDEEYFEPTAVLMAVGHTIVTASSVTGTITGSHGKVATATVPITDVHAKDFDALVVVGGQGSYAYNTNQDVHRVIQDFYTNKKLVAAICHAPIILAKAGVLTGKKATVFAGDKDELQSLGVTYLAEPVVSDTIITANGPHSATQFGQAIARALTT